VAGYALSKFIGVKVISEIHPRRRAAAIIGLICASWLALVAFAMPLESWLRMDGSSADFPPVTAHVVRVWQRDGAAFARAVGRAAS